MTSSCRWVASDSPRVISGRHLDPCRCDGEAGCMPCGRQHCLCCGKNHPGVLVCVGCLEAVRSDLVAIGGLCSALPAEAVTKGVDSEAMMLLGPAADPEAWRNSATSAMLGRLPADYLADARDELHPLWVLATWEQIWREFLRHDTDRPTTLPEAWLYLSTQLGYMALAP